MAEEQNPVTHGELVEIVRRLDERISSMDRSMDERFQAMGERISHIGRSMDERTSSLEKRMVEQFANVNQNLTEMRSDIRMLTRAMIGFYAFIIATVGVGFTLYKLFPNPTP